MKRTDRQKWSTVEVEITVPGDYVPESEDADDDLAAKMNWDVEARVLYLLRSIKGVEVNVRVK